MDRKSVRRLGGRASNLGPELQAKREQYIAEGLVPAEFEPQGDTDRERMVSLEARAYTNWIARNGKLCGNHAPETCRSGFQKRHDPFWTWPEVRIEPLAFTAPPVDVDGFTTASRALPRGDAWEGEDPLFPKPAEDIPPPAEVS